MLDLIEVSQVHVPNTAHSSPKFAISSKKLLSMHQPSATSEGTVAFSSRPSTWCSWILVYLFESSSIDEFVLGSGENLLLSWAFSIAIHGSYSFYFSFAHPSLLHSPSHPWVVQPRPAFPLARVVEQSCPQPRMAKPAKSPYRHDELSLQTPRHGQHLLL